VVKLATFVTSLSVHCNTLHGTEYTITYSTSLVFLCVCARMDFGAEYLKTVKSRGSVSIGHQLKMVYGKSDGYVTDDVT